MGTRLGEAYYVATFLLAGIVAALLITIARRLSR